MSTMHLLLILFLTLSLPLQTKLPKKQLPTKQSPETARLRQQFVEATEDYKASLVKLIRIYEKNVRYAEDKLAVSKKLHAENLIDQSQVEDYERAVQSEKNKLAETRTQLENADDQIKNMLSEAQLQQEYRRAVAVRRRSSVPACNNWTLTAYRRQRGRTTTIAFKLICQD